MNAYRAHYVGVSRALEEGQAPSLWTPPISWARTNIINQITLEFARCDVSAQGRLWWYSELLSLFEKGKELELVDNVIVHGSYGDFTQTAFSDLEITLILNGRCAAGGKYAENFRNHISIKLHQLILSIDPLQHHGPFYLWPQILTCYEENLLPLAAYEHAWSMEPLSLTFHVLHKSSPSYQHSLDATLSALRRYPNRFFRYGQTPFAIKRMLSNIMIVPAFFYQKRGIMISKRAAILRFSTDGPPVVRRVLQVCTRMRSEWPTPRPWVGTLRRSVHRHHIPSGLPDLWACSLYRSEFLKQTIENELLPEMPNFCDAVSQLDATLQLPSAD